LTKAVWKDGECRGLYEEVYLKYLHNSQDINDEFLIEVLKFSINLG
jgi:hypothetical protein